MYKIVSHHERASTKPFSEEAYRSIFKNLEKRLYPDIRYDGMDRIDSKAALDHSLSFCNSIRDIEIRESAYELLAYAAVKQHHYGFGGQVLDRITNQSQRAAACQKAAIRAATDEAYDYALGFAGKIDGEIGSPVFAFATRDLITWGIAVIALENEAVDQAKEAAGRISNPFMKNQIKALIRFEEARENRVAQLAYRQTKSGLGLPSRWLGMAPPSTRSINKVKAAVKELSTENLATSRRKLNALVSGESDVYRSKAARLLEIIDNCH